MTGKTHVAIGFASTVVLSSYVIPSSIMESYTNLVQFKTLPTLVVVIQLAAMILAVWLGSLAPDLDQPGSTLSRDIGGPLGRTKFTALVGGLGLLYLASHLPVILIDVPYISVGFVIVGCILLMMALLKHRGLTHSLLGIGLTGVAVHWGLLALMAKGISYAPSLLLPFLIGYGAHLVADSFTNNGVAPFYVPFVEETQNHWHWPLHVRTGEFVDKVVLRLGAIVLIVVSFVNFTNLRM